MLSAALLTNGTMVGMDHDGDESMRVVQCSKRRENRIHPAAQDDNNNNNKHASTLRDEDALVGDDEGEVLEGCTTRRTYAEAAAMAPRAVPRNDAEARTAPRNHAEHAAAMNLAMQQEWAAREVAIALGIYQKNYADRESSRDPYDMKFVEACTQFQANQQMKQARAVQLAFEIATAAGNVKLCSNQQDKQYWQRSVKDYEITARENGCGHIVVGSK